MHSMKKGLSAVEVLLIVMAVGAAIILVIYWYSR